MTTIIFILIAVIALLVVVNIAAIWMSRKGLTRDDNNNMIPDLLEEKMAELKQDVSIRVDRVGQELKDVGKAIKEVGNQLGDIPTAATGKTRPGRKPKK
jgi:Flp pilus assembly protein TadB